MDYAALKDPWVWTRIGSIYLLVAFVAGCIAYMGNHMGRKIGRKKVTIFGLRPKHTSNLITALTGSLIAITTLTLILIFSEEARRLIEGLDKLRSQMSYLQTEVDKLQHQVYQSRVVWGTGQPIMSGTLEPGLAPATQRTRILNQLDLANVWSVQRNNNIAKENRETPLEASSQLLEWDEAELERIAQEMSTADKVAGVRILASRNCLYKDKVPVKLELMPVTRVFKAGEVVASASLQPDSPELLREWYNFLAAIRETALRRGMIEINDSLGGGLTSEDFDRLIEDIKRLHGPGKLVAVAKTDLYQTNTLSIRVEAVPDRVVRKERHLAARHRPVRGR